MSESSITPLARRLAEENNVDWMKLQGSGPDGWVVEKDVLEYLARVMEGSEALDPTEEPLPDGIASWDEAAAPLDPEAWQAGPASGYEPEAALAESGDELELEELQSVEAEPDEIVLDEGIFLLDEESVEPAVLPVESSGLNAITGTDEDFLLPDDLLDDQTNLLSTDLITDDLLDDDYLEDDFLTDLATEDGELDSPEAADADLHGFGMFGGRKAQTHEIDLLTDDVDLFALETDSPANSQAADFGAEAFGSPQFKDAWGDGQNGAGFAGTGWPEEDGPVPTRRSLQDHLQADSTPATPAPGSFEVDFSEVGAETTASLTAGETEPWEPEPDFELEAGASPEADFELDSETAMASDFGLISESESELEAETLPESAPAAAVAVTPPPASLPLVSHGTLLRRHVDITQLGQVQLAVALELGQEEQLDALPFLLRAAQRSGPLEGSEGNGVAAALLGDAGIRIVHPGGANSGSFSELARHLLDPAQTGDADDRGAGVSVIACDMSALQVDEAVLHLDSPVLALSRVLFDSEQGTYHSTLTLSGTFDPADGARFLQDVSELLASPVRLLI